jgi:DNA topoisomerase-2
MPNPEQKISEFFEDQYTQYAVYDVARKIANYIDGLKMSSRKVVHTVLDKNINKPHKVSRLVSTIAEHTEYMHGEGSLAGVTVGLAQNFVGTNNIPLLKREGNFGTRLIPDAAADRYIFTAKEPILELLIKKEDFAVLDHQHFEGRQIEPKFFVPTLPLLLVNGSEAISTGFSQKILPRDPKELVKYIKAKLAGKRSNVKLLPFYNGFGGNIIETDPGSYLISGGFTRVNSTTIRVTELPVGFTLEKYKKYLEKLEENKTIQDYTDLSNEETFEFEVKVTRDVSKALSDAKLAQLLKLNSAVTENLTCNDEDWSIVQFKNVKQIIDRYMEVKLAYTQKRKDYMLAKMQEDLGIMASKYLFIKGVVNDEIIIHKKKYTQIETQLNKIPRILKVDDSYDYLLRMAISSLTQEKYKDLQEKIKEMKAQYNILKKKTPQEIWLEDIKELEKSL